MNKNTTKNHKETKTKPSNARSLSITILVTITLLAAFTLYFENLKKSSSENNITIQKDNQEPSLSSNKLENTIKKTPLPTKEVTIVQKNKNYIENSSFIIDYFKLHLKAEQGNDFSNELLMLAEYQIESKEIKEILDDLIEVATENVNDSYFAPKFTSLIKSLYIEEQNPTNIFYSYLNKYFSHLFFIRPIGNRAISKGGFDMNIVLTQKAFLENKLEKADEYINKLPNKQLDFKELKLKLKTRIYIRNSISNIDNILHLEAKEK